MHIDDEPASAFRILIVDRDSMSGDLLAASLVRDCQWQATLLEPQNLLHGLRTKGADLVIINADSVGQTGGCFQLVQTISQDHPAVNVIVLVNQPSREHTIQSFRSGARAVFSRQQTMADLLDCIKRVRQGSIWVGRHDADFLLEAFRNLPAPVMRTSPDSPKLSARELQVVTYVAEGKTNRTIAIDLGLSEHTIKNYLFKAFEKLRVSNRVELLFYLTKQGHVFKDGEAFEERRRAKIRRLD